MVSNHVEERPWGGFEILAQFKIDGNNEQDVCVKKHTVKPGARLSYQSHRQRSEHWFFVQGEGTVVLNDMEYHVQPGSSMEVPMGARHRIINASDKEELILIEVTTGHFDENDIQRFEDEYGRT